jgi:hypothetical protein
MTAVPLAANWAIPSTAESSQKVELPLQKVTDPFVTGFPPLATVAVNVRTVPLVMELEERLSVVVVATLEINIT